MTIVWLMALNFAPFSSSWKKTLLNSVIRCLYFTDIWLDWRAQQCICCVFCWVCFSTRLSTYFYSVSLKWMSCPLYLYFCHLILKNLSFKKRKHCMCVCVCTCGGNFSAFHPQGKLCVVILLAFHWSFVIYTDNIFLRLLKHLTSK